MNGILSPYYGDDGSRVLDGLHSGARFFVGLGHEAFSKCHRRRDVFALLFSPAPRASLRNTKRLALGRRLCDAFCERMALHGKLVALHALLGPGGSFCVWVVGRISLRLVGLGGHGSLERMKSD